MITKYTVSRDDSIYEAWPDVTLTQSGKLVCVFSECTHHGDRSYTRIMLTESTDKGRTWAPKYALTEGTKDLDYFYNCARISTLKNGQIVVLVDKLYNYDENKKIEDQHNVLYFSEDDGVNWSDQVMTPALGMVPDKLQELKSGRWLLGCHVNIPEFDFLVQRLWYSDDQGKSWEGPVIVGRQEGFNFCEVSILEVEDNILVAFMRENSGRGDDCYKTISYNAGESWSEPIKFPLPGCHRPVSGYLQDGHIMITHRYMHGGKGWIGTWTQNFFAGLTDKDSALALRRHDAWARILPIDFDRSSKSDLGYSGWVQFDDGEIYIVNYIMDDAEKAQIRGYSLTIDDFLIQ